MPKKIFSSHWFWFFTLLTLYSYYDIYDHLARENESFRDHPISWTLFSLASMISVLLIAYITSKSFQRARLPELIASMLGVAVAVFFHLTVTAPLWDRIFWDGNLMFNQVLIPTAAGVVIYFIFRLFFYLVKRVLPALKA